MTKTKLGLLATSLSALLLSVGAGASELGMTAHSPGPGGGEVPGIPTEPVVGGGGSCYFAYHIRKVAIDDDHHIVADDNHDGDDHRDEARFKIFVTNIGNCFLRRIDVTDFLPEGTELVRAEPRPDNDHDQDHDRRIVWRDIRLEVGERQTFEISVRRRDHDHNHDRDRRIQNTACAFTPFIGIRICDSALAFLDDDHHHDHGPSSSLN